MRVAVFAVTSLFCAGAAYAQDLPCGGDHQKATKAFVENFNAASNALQAEDYMGAIGGAALARPHAIYGMQLAAVRQVEIAAYAGLKSPSLEPALNEALAMPCMQPKILARYREMLAELRAAETAPQQH